MMGGKVGDMRYIIVSKGRANDQHTYNMLVGAGILDIHIYIYPEDLEGYSKTTPLAKLHTGDYTNLLEKRRYIMQEYLDNHEISGFFMLDDDILEVALLKTIDANRVKDGMSYKVARPLITDTLEVFERIPALCKHYGLAVVSGAPKGTSHFTASKAVYMNKGRINGIFYWDLVKLRELEYNPYYFNCPNIIEDQYLSLMMQKNRIPYLRLNHWSFKLPDWFTQTGGNIPEYNSAHEFDASKVMELTKAINDIFKENTRREYFEGMYNVRRGRSYYYIDYVCKHRKLLTGVELTLFK
jgi:hypothetical protein